MPYSANGTNSGSKSLHAATLDGKYALLAPIAGTVLVADSDDPWHVKQSSHNFTTESLG